MKLLLVLAVACAACGDTTIFDPMERQPKMRAFAANALYADGRSMRAPPEGTVPREHVRQNPELDAQGNVIDQIPVSISRAQLEHGRGRFDIQCAVCHGLLGDGVSPVATQMSLRPPPNLHKLRNPSPGHIYQVISEGFGLMPSYSAQLSVEERWEVVAYVQALRLSQSGKLADVPPDIAARMTREAAP